MAVWSCDGFERGENTLILIAEKVRCSAIKSTVKGICLGSDVME